MAASMERFVSSSANKRVFHKTLRFPFHNSMERSGRKNSFVIINSRFEL